MNHDHVCRCRKCMPKLKQSARTYRTMGWSMPRIALATGLPVSTVFRFVADIEPPEKVWALNGETYDTRKPSSKVARIRVPQEGRKD